MGGTVEVCVESAEAAQAAEAGGADRVELCAAMEVGGLTPSGRAVAETRRRLKIPFRVLIRPRAGDFVYTEAEFVKMINSVDMARDLGASGVVLGVNRPSGVVDLERTERLVGGTGWMGVTFHKAFDELVDPFAALEALASLGIDRVLTSGGAATAREGLPRLAELVRRSAGRITIMAGGRLRKEDVAPLAAAGVRDFHIGSAAFRDGITDAAMVRSFVEEVRRVVP